MQGMKSLPDYVEFKSFPGTPLKDIFSAAGDDLLDLLARLLDCNPNGRVSSTQVNLNLLRDFTTSVYMCDDGELGLLTDDAHIEETSKIIVFQRHTLRLPKIVYDIACSILL